MHKGDSGEDDRIALFLGKICKRRCGKTPQCQIALAIEVRIYR
jgi:hypothetical protein